MAFGDDSLVPEVTCMVTTACPKFAVASIEIDRPGEPLQSIAARVGTALVRNPLLASQFADVKRDES
jgi:hypothetical protein